MTSLGGGRSHILLTGIPGIGKTTLVRRICQHLAQRGKKHRGFYTVEKREAGGGGRGAAGRRIGFDIVPVPEGIAGPSSPLARLSETNPQDRRPRVGPYSVDVASIEAVASAHLRPVPAAGGRGGGGEQRAAAAAAVGGDDDVIYYIVDEIGKMELYSSTFTTLVSRLFDSRGGAEGVGAGRGVGRGLRRGGPVGRGSGGGDRGGGGGGAVLVVATLPVVPSRGRPNAFVEGIRNRKDAILFTVTRENRDVLFDEIVAHL